MRRIVLLTLLLALSTISLFAQGGGVKGRVIDRVGRGSIEGAKIVLATEMGESVATNKNGEFVFHNILPGSYRLIVNSQDKQSVEITVKVNESGKVTNLGNISMVSNFTTRGIDEFEVTEQDVESESGGEQAMSGILSSSQDVFDNIAGYKFSSIRFRTRGYDSGLTDVYLNGIKFNDALTGYSPWSLWSGLNDATRNQEVTSGAAVTDYGVGGINGSANINARASQVRKGYRFSFVNASGMYRFRVMATYGSGVLDNGWSYALSLSTRQGGNDWVNGVYYDSWGYFGSVEKKINPFHKLAFTFMGAPGERAVQGASTQEVYDLVNSNQYNSNWGYQNGRSNSDRRAARVRESHEPIAMLNYYYEPNANFRLTASASFRFGKNGYSALDWQDAQDPRPDYYRNLPSYFDNAGEEDKARFMELAWRTDWNTRQIDWDRMYNVNYNSLFDRNDQTDYHGGVKPFNDDGTAMKRSKYVLEDRRTDQKDFNAKLHIRSIVSGRSRINAGLEARINRTEYYKTVKDLLGGDYYLDIDQFAERDFGPGSDQVQSNLHTPDRLVKKGDKYGYDYYAHVHNYKLWATYKLSLPFGLTIDVGAEGGNNRMWREGRYRKGLFPFNSYGESEKRDYWTYTAKLGVTYRISGVHTIYANVTNMRIAPYFRDAFVSARTRNTITPGLTTEKVTSVDLNYALNLPTIKLRATGFYTKIKDRMKQISFYDDAARLTDEGRAGMFTNFSMSGIDQEHMGVELGVSVPIYGGISAEGAFSYGRYMYTSNPLVTQTVDNSEALILDKEPVRWKNMKVESTPQTAINVGLRYAGAHNIYAGVDVSYFDALYLSMNPLYRTDKAHAELTKTESQAMAKQEMFRHNFVLNANIGKQWYLKGGYNLGFSLEIKNILNDKKIKTGGYEQMRLKKRTIGELNDEGNATTGQRYQRFDSKYFYMMGTTYYLNIYVRF